MFTLREYQAMPPEERRYRQGEILIDGRDTDDVLDQYFDPGRGTLEFNRK